MKNIIIILLLSLLPFSLAAQKVDFNQQDKQVHFAAGFFISSVANIETYNIIKDSNLKPWQSKAISFVSGVTFGTLAGHAKERFDEKNNKVYSKNDFRATLYGALCGSFTIRLVLWNSIPESKVLDNEIIF